MKTRISRKSLCNALAVAVLAVPMPALAANHAYTGTDGGFWNTATNWTPNGVPVNGDTGYIQPNNTNVTVNFNGNYANPGLLDFLIDSIGFGTGTLSQSSNAMVIQGQLQVGATGSGQYIQSGGSNTTNSIFIGVAAGGSGTYQLSGSTASTTLNTTGTYVGNSGNGAFMQSGGTHTTGSLYVGGSQAGGNGNYTLTNGNLNAVVVNIGGPGSGNFQQSGGTVTISSQLHPQVGGNYTLNNGNLNANFLNDGNFSISNGSLSGSGTNNNTLTIANGGMTITAGGFTNNALFNIYGGTIVTNGPSLNNGQILVNGNALLGGNAAFNNYGVINFNQGNLTLNGTGPLANSGNINLAAGYGLALAANFTNTGTVTLNSGHVLGPATLINRFGGTVRGSGLITSLDNQGGRMLVTDGTMLISNAFTSSGIIQLADDSASLAGGAITNSGEVSGHGIINNQINNIGGGMIEARDGTLILGGGVNNGAEGTLSATAGSKLLLPGGISTSGGLINLSGGAFDNNTFALSNTGQISGFGTVRTGGLTNSGSMTLTGGFSTVQGNVTNAASKQIKIAYNPALFTGAVTNNGIFKTTGTTVTFSGSYTENGTFISDPSDNYFIDVFLNSPGAWTGGAGDRFFVKGTLDWSGGSMNGAGAQTFNQGSATLHDANTKTLNGWIFNNEKPLTLSGGNIDMGNGASVNNTSSFEIQGTAGISNTLGGAATFANQGTLRKTGARTISSIAARVTNNNGNIDVPAGILSLDGGLNIAAATNLPKTGAGDLTISGPQSHGAGAQLTANSGSIHLISNAGTPATVGAAASATLTLNVSGDATVALGGNQDLKELNIPIANAGNQSLDLNTPGTRGAFNAIRVYSADLATAKTTLWSAIKNANGAGSLTPVDGIFDSGKIAHAGTGIGLARINDARGDSHIQVRLARIGDLNLDGTVSISDFIDLASNFGSSAPTITWQEGDLNYDGSVSISDFIDLASNFGSSYSGDIATVAQFAESIGVDAAIIGSAVPEPGIALGIGAAVTGLAMRRRKLAHGIHH